SPVPRRLDRGDIDLLHPHHRLEGALGGGLIRAGDRFQEHPWGDLPGQAPLVLAPTALAFDSPVLDARVPVPIGLGLALRDDLAREGFAMFEGRAPSEAEA